MDSTAIINGAITACINGIAMFLVLRYTGRLVEKIENKTKNKKEEETKKD